MVPAGGAIRGKDDPAGLTGDARDMRQGRCNRAFGVHQRQKLPGPRGEHHPRDVLAIAGIGHRADLIVGLEAAARLR